MVQGASMFPEPHIWNAVVPDNIGMVANGSKGVPTSRTTHINAIVPDNQEIVCRFFTGVVVPLSVFFYNGKGFLSSASLKVREVCAYG
jgi:hypothetical protein